VNRRSVLVGLVTAATLGSGLVTLAYGAAPPAFGREERLAVLVPFAVLPASRLAALLVGLATVVTAVNVARRKQRAWSTAMALAALSAAIHLVRGPNYAAAGLALGLMALLGATRGTFTVRSGAPTFRWAVAGLVASAAGALVYGVVGFWVLDPREFGINFTVGRAAAATARFLLLLGDPAVVPRTRHARLFLASLPVATAAVTAYGLASLYRPIAYLRRTRPAEREEAARILEQWGRTSLDVFKLLPDKSLYFSESRRSVLAYSVGRGFALALGDPVGPPAEMRSAIESFSAFCRDNGWGVGFHQVPGDLLPTYQAAGFRHLRIGDCAIVDLKDFSIEGPAGREWRATVRKVENKGIRHVRFEPPLSDETIDSLQEVSDEWLRIGGRRERAFTVGQFGREYVRATPVVAAIDATGRPVAFVNVVRSYRPGEATIDLMRHRADAPNKIMDYLFVKLFLWDKEHGFERFDLGLAPLSGLLDLDDPTAEEAAVQAFLQRLSFIFRFVGLKQYKAKFATWWEPSYVAYRSPLDLVRFAVALAAVSEVGGAPTPDGVK
jgi:phosphatidylglycerol lysyltransferase